MKLIKKLENSSSKFTVIDLIEKFNSLLILEQLIARDTAYKEAYGISKIFSDHLNLIEAYFAKLEKDNQTMNQ